VVVSLAGCGGDDSPERDSRTVAVFGDSLTFQAWPALQDLAARRGLRLFGHAFPGAAICDAHTEIAETLERERPAVVVIAYVGNNVTPCTGLAQADELGDRYEADAEAVAELVEQDGARLHIVLPPDMNDDVLRVNADAVRSRYERVAADHPDIELVDGRRFLSPDGFTPTLPCLPSEAFGVGCTDGRITVRDPDGVHLSPPIAVGYSAGGVRWADACLSGISGNPRAQSGTSESSG
jgi:hypothetical protein